MAGEVVKVRGTTKTVEASGAAVTAGAMSAASGSTYGTTADGSDYPDAEFVLTVSFGAAPIVGSSVVLFAQPLDIDGTADAPAPSTSYRHRRIGAFVASAATSQTLILAAQDVPLLASYYLLNLDSGQQMSAGWTLMVTPVTYQAAP